MPAERSAHVGFLEQALSRLEEALAKPEDAIVRDASIQRFEFTFEMAWKAIQRYAYRPGPKFGVVVSGFSRRRSSGGVPSSVASSFSWTA